MPSTSTKEKREGSSARKPARAGLRYQVPWGYLLLAGIPLSLSAYYLTQVAPDLVPIPQGVKVPFPILNQVLEPVCVWSGENPQWILGIGGLLLLAGLLFRVSISRYYVTLAVTTTLALGLTWYSISAPVDRLIKNVEDNLPRDQRLDGVLKR